MSTDNWINLIVAILVGGGTLALAYMTWKSIRQSRNIQKTEKRERLLNEIIEWAMGITKCQPDETISIATGTGAATINVDQIKITKLGLMYLTISARSGYMADIAGSVFGQDIHNAVKTVTGNLNKFEDILNEYLDSKATEKMVATVQVELHKSAEVLIKETAKIKTKDIGKKEENMSKEGEVTGSNEPTVKDIEEHLKKQDEEMKKIKLTTIGTVGLAVLLVGIGFWKQEGFNFYSMSGQTYFMLSYGVFITAISALFQKRVKYRAYILAAIIYIAISFLFFYFQPLMAP